MTRRNYQHPITLGIAAMRHEGGAEPARGVASRIGAGTASECVLAHGGAMFVWQPVEARRPVFSGEAC